MAAVRTSSVELRGGGCGPGCSQQQANRTQLRGKHCFAAAEERQQGARKPNTAREGDICISTAASHSTCLWRESRL